MRDEKRNIQRRLKSVENTLEQKLRDASRRARKLTQLQNFLQDRENSLASSFEGELTPEFLHQKLTQIQTISDELQARNGDFQRANQDAKLQAKYHKLSSDVKSRVADLQEAKGSSQELDGLLQDFKDWNDKCLEKTLGTSGSKLTSNYEIINSMREECQEKEEDIDLIRALFDSISNVGKTWNNKSVNQIMNDLEHSLKRIKSLLQEKTEQAGDAINKINRFVDSIDDLTGWYAEILPELEMIKKSINFIDKQEIDLLCSKVKKLNQHLVEKNSTRELLAREASVLENDFNSDASTKVFSKLKSLNETATKSEQQCRDLDLIVEKASRSAGKYFEAKDQLMPWLKATEERFEKDFSSPSSDDYEAIIEDLSLLSEDVAERRLLVDRVVTAGDKLASMGASQIRNESENMSHRYQEIRDLCRSKKREYQQILIEHQQYTDRLKLLKNSLTRIMDRINNLEPPEVTGSKHKSRKVYFFGESLFSRNL